ncbi:molybdenum cofactor guanylyltransferase [Alkaliphilus serpentinus]|uniref:Probable molybdenum cofactor guanylyltransferase n=1 Tax=Alkaliphilus serpentinus TaxID=1482731 RepID=A0A833HP32_9FIRM|nr:molybdenum cofactor guanylyltransferase [Alkaliphilus serpentinus]KAB3530236.1 molybdenum cofactor guanylyltransferase [Alkaliphilus serpentinus]
MQQNKVSAVILAGGASSRMGHNKALMKLGVKTMIEWVIDPLRDVFNEIIIITNNPEEYSFLEDVRFVDDCIRTISKNSLVGILTGLYQSTSPYVFVTACDMPFLNVQLLKYMVEFLGKEDILIPFIGGFYEPLHSIYGKNCISAIESQLRNQNYKIADFFNDVKVKKLSEEVVRRLDPKLKSFININTIEDFHKYLNQF